MTSAPLLWFFAGCSGESSPTPEGAWGFAGVRIPLQLDASVAQVSFNLQEAQGLAPRVVFTTTSRAVDGIEGQLSYQAILAAGSEPNLRSVELRQLQPFVRGRALRQEQAPTFLPEQVTRVAIELKLSDQRDGQQPEGVPFEIVFPGLASPDSLVPRSN